MEHNYEVLAEQIKNLSEKLGTCFTGITKKVEDGFKGVHARQDRTNSQIDKNRFRIEKLEKADIGITNSINACKLSWKLYWVAITTAISIILYLLGKYVY